VNDWAFIRNLSIGQGLSNREIARQLGINRKTVARYLASDEPPAYQRELTGSKVDPYLPAMRALLVKDPTLKATVLAERVGFNGGHSTSLFRAKVAGLKAELGVADPADRLSFSPGEQGQFDLWFPRTAITATGLIHPVLTLIACWSRFLLAVMIPTRQCGDILAGMNLLLGRLGGLPQRILWDNESGIVHNHQLIAQASVWAGTMGASIKLAKPYDPETKGRVERANGYLGTSFEPAREFDTIADFNSQLDEWLEVKANQRLVRATGQRPIDMIAEERQALLPLPAQMPPAAIEITTRLPRDYYLRVVGNDYSIDPSVIGKQVSVRATLDRVQATCEGRVVADHERVFTGHQVITDPAHVEQARKQRGQFEEAKRKQPRHLVLVEQRDLATYDLLYRAEAA